MFAIWKIHELSMTCFVSPVWKIECGCARNLLLLSKLLPICEWKLDKRVVRLSVPYRVSYCSEIMTFHASLNISCKSITGSKRTVLKLAVCESMGGMM